MAAKKETPAPTKTAPEKTPKRAPAKPSDVKAQTQEAKDLRALTEIMSQKNSPQSSKEITVFAKETLKMVSQSQKTESAAYKREATKNLIQFRNFVEKTTKLTETRRAQLLSQIDNVSLDSKNAVMMMLSVATTQAKNIKQAAKREVAAEKLKVKQFEKATVAEAEAKAKSLESESKLKSKALRQEQEEKFKVLAEQRSSRYKEMMEKGQDRIREQKENLKIRRDEHKASIEKQKLDLEDRKKTNKDRYDQLKLQLNQSHDKRKADLAQEKLDLKTKYDKRKTDLDQQKLDQSTKNAQAQIDLRNHRAAAAAQIKKLRSDVRDDYKTKMNKGRAEILQKKQDAAAQNRARIQKIRDMTTEHKIRLKKILDDAKEESLLKRHEFKKKMSADEEKQATKKRNLGDLGNKVKDGVYQSNPLLHAIMEIGGGLGVHTAVKDRLSKRKEKKEAAKLNKLQRTTGKAPAPAGATTPSAGGSTTPPASSKGSGGMFSNLIPTVSGLISGIGSFLGSIVSGFGKLGGMLLSGARFVPVIAGVAAIIGSVWKFVEGFNDATSLFGEKIEDDDYVKRTFAGFTNVISSVLGIFDTVAGWLGFDTNLEGDFKKGAVKLFNSILDTFRSVAAGLGSLLEYIPGMGGVAKSLKSYSEPKGEIKPNSASAAGALTQKTQAVNDLKDQVDASRNKGGTSTAVIDNSVKQNSTTIVQGKMDTRNDDSSIKRYTN